MAAIVAASPRAKRPSTALPATSAAEAPAAKPAAMGSSSSGGRLRPPAKLAALDWQPSKAVSDEELAKRKAARAAAQAAGAGVLAKLRAAKSEMAQAVAARSIEEAAQLEKTVSSLWSRCERAAAKAGLEMNGNLPAGGKLFATSSEVRKAATTLRKLAFEARRVEEGRGTKASAVERVAVMLSHRADTLARVLQRSEALCEAWRQRQSSEVASPGPSGEGISPGAPCAAPGEAPDQGALAAKPHEAARGAVPPAVAVEVSSGGLRESVAEQVEKAFRMSKRFKPAHDAVSYAPDESGSEPPDHPPREMPTSAKSAKQTKQATYLNALGKLHIEPMAYKLVLSELPATIPVPPASSAGMCSSLLPVLDKLNQAVDFKSAEYEAAKNAFASWHDTTWVDPRRNVVREKAAKGWTTEQYALPGFAGIYARSLHIARVATLRQVIMWLLESAPGLPADGPMSIGDLGAGTCAACLGARYALRDYSSGEHPFKVWPIDVASSSARFEEAFKAMTESGSVPRWGSFAAGGFTRETLLPDQAPSQYLKEERPGVDHLATSLLEQLAARGERQPHLILASFSLHYLKRDARTAFFVHLKTIVKRPLLLLVVKGVDSVARHRTEPMISESSVPSTFMGIHYFLGRDPKPRVVEAHLVLIEPAGAERPLPSDLSNAHDRDDADSWVLSTYVAVARRCSQHGLYQGTTELPEEKLAAATWT